MNRISYKTHEERVSALAQSLSLPRFLAWRLGISPVWARDASSGVWNMLTFIVSIAGFPLDKFYRNQ